VKRRIESVGHRVRSERSLEIIHRLVGVVFILPSDNTQSIQGVLVIRTRFDYTVQDGLSLIPPTHL
jgi:hypothetical protein